MGRDVRKIDICRLWDPSPPLAICFTSDIVSATEAGQDATEGRMVSVGVRVSSSEREAELFPAPSAEMVLLRLFVQSYLATAPRRRAEAFLRHATKLLETEEGLSLLLPIRPQMHDAARSEARQEAVIMFRQLLPALVASMAGGA